MQHHPPRFLFTVEPLSGAQERPHLICSHILVLSRESFPEDYIKPLLKPTPAVWKKSAVDFHWLGCGLMSARENIRCSPAVALFVRPQAHDGADFLDQAREHARKIAL